MIPNDGCSSFPFAQPNERAKDDTDAVGLTSLPTNTDTDTESKALHSLKLALSNIPHEEKSALVHAQRTESGLVNDDHLLSFLRVEDFDINVRDLGQSGDLSSLISNSF